MPTYKLDIQYVYETEYWTNKLYVIEPDMEAAANAAETLCQVLKTGIQDSVTIDKVRITPFPYQRNTYRDVQIDVAGTGGSTPPAPLFNVVRWEFSRAYGRAVSHYFRGGVTTSNLGPNQQFTPAAKTFNDNLVTALFETGPIICDKIGDPYTRATTSLLVGMRQLRRGSKRKKTPVI